MSRVAEGTKFRKDSQTRRITIDMSTITAQCIEQCVEEWLKDQQINNPRHCMIVLHKGLNLLSQMPKGEIDFDD